MKIFLKTAFVILFILAISKLTQAQINLGIHSGASNGRDVTLKISSPANYQGQLMAGAFFIIRWPTTPEGSNVMAGDFIGHNGFPSSDWQQSTPYPWYHQSGSYSYRLLEINSGLFNAGPNWNAPNNIDILSFNMVGGVGVVALELATDAEARAMADFWYGTNLTYYSDINMNGSPTVTSIGPSTVVGVTLPLSLKSFSVKAVSCNASLMWETADEENTSYFDIEYSAIGSSFSKVGEVSAKDKSIGASYYFSYAQPAAKGYYRLKMVDLDGHFTYSQVVSLSDNCGNGRNDIKAYPNPVVANGQLYIIVQQPKAGKLQLKVMDINGQLVKSISQTLSAGNTVIPMPELSQLPASTYLIQAQFEDGEIKTTRIVRQ